MKIIDAHQHLYNHDGMTADALVEMSEKQGIQEIWLSQGFSDVEWEVVSINGRLKKEDPPMDPMTIIRNWKHLSGGTEMKGKTSDEVLEMLCQSIMYKNGIKEEKNED